MVFEDDLKVSLPEERVTPAKPSKGKGEKKRGSN
jgi:hypothetical protein